MNIEEIKLVALTCNEPLKKADAIVCLEGDEHFRTAKALELFKQNWAPLIVVSGGLIVSKFSNPAPLMAEYLVDNGVHKNKIIIESVSQNTYEQAREVMKITKGKKWKSIILIASEFHQARAYLTFLKAMYDCRVKIRIFNAPTTRPWFEKTKLGINRIDLLSNELDKIKKYLKSKHLLSIKQALEYQKWKEK
jgi:uncharacterized SAM-binding protein YcdF (DUF218 family)